MALDRISQINDIKQAYYKLTALVQNHNGYFWIATHNSVSVAAGASHYIAMTMGDTELELVEYDITTDALDADTTYFEGGQFSGGTSFAITCLNRILNTVIPAADAAAGVVIDVAGLSILKFKIRGTASIFGADIFGGVGKETGLIMKENETYYFEVTNNDAQTRIFDFVFKIVQHNS